MIPLNESFQIAASDFAMALPEAFESHPNRGLPSFRSGYLDKLRVLLIYFAVQSGIWL
jgi:hypothetical protein